MPTGPKTTPLWCSLTEKLQSVNLKRMTCETINHLIKVVSIENDLY